MVNCVCQNSKEKQSLLHGSYVSSDIFLTPTSKATSIYTDVLKLGKQHFTREAGGECASYSKKAFTTPETHPEFGAVENGEQFWSGSVLSQTELAQQSVGTQGCLGWTWETFY